MTRIFDISLPYSSEMVTWPGDPSITLKREIKIEDGNDSNVSRLDMGVHTGTHIDAPFHFVFNGATIDKIDLDILVGEVQVVRIPDEIIAIDRDVVENAEIQTGVKRVLFKTKNSVYWKQAANVFHEEFVAIMPDAAMFLVEKGIKLIGIDYLSVAPFIDGKTTHQILLRAGIVAVEGLNLTEVKAGMYRLICLPLKLVGSDGAPARVILLEE